MAAVVGVAAAAAADAALPPRCLAAFLGVGATCVALALALALAPRRAAANVHRDGPSATGLRLPPADELPRPSDANTERAFAAGGLPALGLAAAAVAAAVVSQLLPAPGSAPAGDDTLCLGMALALCVWERERRAEREGWRRPENRPSLVAIARAPLRDPETAILELGCDRTVASSVALCLWRWYYERNRFAMRSNLSYFRPPWRRRASAVGARGGVAHSSAARRDKRARNTTPRHLPTLTTHCRIPPPTGGAPGGVGPSSRVLPPTPRASAKTKKPKHIARERVLFSSLSRAQTRADCSARCSTCSRLTQGTTSTRATLQPTPYLARDGGRRVWRR